MIISPEQVRAARAMLDWSQDMLAKESGLSLATIHNLEKGQISSRSSSEVRKIFENKGFEFHGNSGVNRRCEETKTFHGRDSIDRFYEDMLLTLKKKNGRVAAVFKTQELLTCCLGASKEAGLQRLEELSKHASIKCLLTEARQSPLFIPWFQFKTFNQHQIIPWSTFIYDNKSVMVVTTNRIDFTFFVIKSIESAQDGLKEFDTHWDAAFPFASAIHSS